MKSPIYIFVSTCVLLFACGKNNQKVVKPVFQPITETVFASGILDNDYKYNLTAQSDGYLNSVNFIEGDQIIKGKLLAIIDNPTSTANAEAAKLQLSIAEYNTTENAPALKQLTSNIEFAERKLQQDLQQLNRYKKLMESNSISKLEYENIKIAADNSEANLASLKQQYNTIKQQAEQQKITQEAANKVNTANSGYNRVVALSDGKILKRMKQQGDYVRKGDIIAVIGKPQSIIAKLNVDENSINKVKVGQDVNIRLNVQKNEIYKGKVNEILPVFDDATQSFICKVSFEKDPDFKITGTQLEANILVGKKDKALLIPRTYLGFGNKVKVQGKEDLVEVKTGIVSSEWAEITEGISPNDELLPLKP